MAAIGNIPIKILAQAPNSEPVEIGSYELPVHIGHAFSATNGNVNIHMTVGEADPDELARIVTERLRRASFINLPS